MIGLNNVMCVMGYLKKVMLIFLVIVIVNVIIVFVFIFYFGWGIWGVVMVIVLL